MSDFISLSLEKPHKIERLLNNILKILLTTWLLNKILEYYNVPLVVPDKLSFDFIGKTSPFDFAIYLVLFTSLWGILWQFITFSIIPFIGKLVSSTLANITYYAIVGIEKVTNLFKTKKGQNTSTEKEGHEVPQEKVTFFPKSTYFFDLIDKLTKTIEGSRLLYTIIQHKQSEFIKSRIISYYSVSLTAFIGYYLQHPTHTNWFFWCIMAILIYLLLLISIMNEVYNDLYENDLSQTILKLERTIFFDFVYQTIDKHPISRQLKLKKTRKEITIHNNKNPDEKLITVLVISSENEVVHYSSRLDGLSNNNSEQPPTIIVSNMLPDIPLKNFLTVNNLFFIYVKDSKDSETLSKGLTQIERLINKRKLVDQDN